MILRLRPKRILFLSFLFFLSLELLNSISPPSWYFYYDHAVWDKNQKKFIPVENPTEIDQIVRYIRQGFK